MAYIQCKLASEVLGTSVPVQLYYPTDLPAAVGNTVKGVLTLLHGYGGDCDCWFHMTAACRYAADNGLVLVAPSVSNSFYTDMVHGGAYYTFITQELPKLLGDIFKLPTEREHNYIAGLSMGGYGALLLALSQPQRYAACASFSGCLDVQELPRVVHSTTPQMYETAKAVMGESLQIAPQYDLFALAQKAAQLPAQQRPRIMCTCGDDDFLLEQNQRFVQHARKVGLPLEYTRWPGNHEWKFWDRSLSKAIGFFLQSDYYNAKLADWNSQEVRYE